MKNQNNVMFKLAVFIVLAWMGYSLHTMANSQEQSENVGWFQKNEKTILDTKTGAQYLPEYLEKENRKTRQLSKPIKPD